MKTLALAALLPMAMLASPVVHAQADPILDMTALIRNVQDAADPNIGHMRVIMPMINATRDVNGVPKTVSLRLNVYDPTGGVNSPLFATTVKSAPFAAMPCTSPASWSDDYTLKFLGRWNGQRAHVVMSMKLSCNESGTGEYKEGGATFVYSADVRQAAGSVWTKAYQLPLFGANSLDLTNGSATLGTQDGIGETLMLTLGASTGARVVLLNFDNGALFSNGGWTMPSDRIYGIGNY